MLRSMKCPRGLENQAGRNIRILVRKVLRLKKRVREYILDVYEALEFFTDTVTRRRENYDIGKGRWERCPLKL